MGDHTAGSGTRSDTLAATDMATSADATSSSSPSDQQQDWASSFCGIDTRACAQPGNNGGASSGGAADASAFSSGTVASVKLGPVRITEETLGPPVGPGPAADTLYAFMAEDGSGPADHQASPTAAALNEAGGPLQAEVATTLKHFMTWKHAVAVIQEDQKKGGGPAALKSVKDSAGAIGNSARGSGGSGLREGTQKFFDMVKDAETVVDELAAQVDKVSAANHQFTALLWDDAAQKQGRVVENNKDAVQEEKEKIEERKKQIESKRAIDGT